MKQVGRELGVRYVLEGSVRKAGNRVRITAQLIEAETGTHLWADRFDGSLEDVFDLAGPGSDQRRRRHRAGTSSGRDRARAAARPTAELDAYDLYLRALATYFPITRDGFWRHWVCWSRRSRSTRDYGPALSWAAVCHWQCVTDGWAEAPEAARRQGVELARRALEATRNDDPGVLANASFILANFGEDIGAMIGSDRPGAEPQSELRTGLEHQRPSAPVRRRPRSRYRACRDRAAPEPPRAGRDAAGGHWPRVFL